MQSQCKDLELKLKEVDIASQNKESGLLDNKITGTQSFNSQNDQNKRKAMRVLKEKLDDVTNELNSKNNIFNNSTMRFKKNWKGSQRSRLRMKTTKNNWSKAKVSIKSNL